MERRCPRRQSNAAETAAFRAMLLAEIWKIHFAHPGRVASGMRFGVMVI